MMCIKKSLTIMVVFILVMSYFSASEAQELDFSKLAIGLSMLTLDAPYYAAQLQAAKEATEKLGAKFYSTDAKGDMVKQIADVEDLLARGVDLLILNPKDPKALVPATKAATAEGVPVIIIDSGIDPSADYVTLIQSDNTANGELVGSWLVQQMKGEPIKMAVMSGSQGSVVGRARRHAVFAGVIAQQLRDNNKTDFEIVTQGWGGWNAEGGLKAMEDILVAHQDFNVLAAENDSMALGALRAIEEAGRADDILVIAAADGQKEAYQAIKEGRYGATGLNDPALIAKTAVDVGIRYLQGEKDFPKVYYTPPACITKENVDEFYNPNAVF